MKNAGILLGIIVLIAIGMVAESRLHWLQSDSSTGMPATVQEPEVLYWVAPMDPNYRRDQPGKSPMGMDLVPVYAGEERSNASTVQIAPSVEQNLGVRTATAESGRLWRRISAVGTVEEDESQIRHLHLRTDGWIEKTYVSSVGDTVDQGQLVLEVYAPAVVNAQNEYLQALRRGESGLIAAARDKLVALGMDDRDITSLRDEKKVSRTMRVWAPASGVVTELNARDGMYVMPSDDLMSLTDLSSVWLDAEVYESQASWLEVGQTAEARLGYLPGRVFEGTVSYVYPVLDPDARTLRARLRFDNPDLLLKPNMYAQVFIYGGALADVLSVPAEAVIRSGTMDRVVVALGEGSYQVREVETGTESGDWIQILRGLREGEQVVTSAQFLIDSEASLAGAIQRLGSGAPNRMLHEGMDRGSMEAEPREQGEGGQAEINDGAMDHEAMDHGAMDHGGEAEKDAMEPIHD